MGETLTPEVAIRYAASFATLSPPGPLVITQDGRPSGQMLAHVVQGGLQAVGRTTIDMGVAATPTTGVLVRQTNAAGGMQISASHNPLQYNGLKLFSPEGRVIPAGPGQRVLDLYRRGETAWARTIGWAAASKGPIRSPPISVAVLATIDVERIRKRHFRVLLDSNHGAGSVLGHRLLTHLGCRVTVLGGLPDGQFEHTPEPTAENLAGVLSSVREAGAEVGFCQDPDADRLAVINENGRYLGEEYTLAMCVDHVLRRRKGPIVTNCSTSRMSQDLADRYGVAFFRSAVGEANVVDCMLAHEAVFGGEGNGGPINPTVGLVRDSFVGMAQLLDAMAARDVPISRLADELPRWSIVKTKMSVPPGRVADALIALERHFAGAKADRLDGLRLDWPEGWLLVRPSNTEPIVRAISEADTAERASGWCQEAARVIAEVIISTS